MKFIIDINGAQREFEIEDLNVSLIQQVEKLITDNGKINTSDIRQAQNYVKYNNNIYEFNNDTVLKQIVKLISQNSASESEIFLEHEKEEEYNINLSKGTTTANQTLLNNIKAALPASRRNTSTGTGLDQVTEEKNNALNVSLELSNHLRTMGFKVTPEEAAVLLTAYVNSAMSVLPFYSSARDAGKLAIVPGTSWMPEKLRISTYVWGSVPATNFLLNGDTSYARIKELIRRYLGHPDYRGNIKQLYKGLTKDNTPLGKKVLEEIGRLVSLGWSIYSALSFVELGLETGMNPIFVPSTFLAFGFLHLGGLNSLVLGLMPSVAKWLYSKTAMHIQRMPQIHQPTQQERNLNKLKAQRLAALLTGYQELLRMMNKPETGDKEKINELLSLLKQTEEDSAEQKKVTFELLAKLTELGSDPAEKSTREKHCAKILALLSGVSSVVGLYGYMVATVQGAHDSIGAGAVSFAPFQAMVTRASYEISKEYAHAGMHPRETWEHRPAYMRHFPVTSKLILGTSLIAVYLSTGPLLVLAQDGLNYAFERNDLCPVNATTADTSSNQTRYSNQTMLMDPMQCTPNPELWHMLYNILLPFGIAVTGFFNPYGIPGALKNIYRSATWLGRNKEHKNEYLLLEFLLNEMDKVGAMNRGAFLAEMHEYAKLHQTGMTGSEINMNTFFATYYFADEFSDVFKEYASAIPSEKEEKEEKEEEEIYLNQPKDFVTMMNTLYGNFKQEQHPDFETLWNDIENLPELKDIPSKSTIEALKSNWLFKNCCYGSKGEVGETTLLLGENKATSNSWFSSWCNK